MANNYFSSNNNQYDFNVADIFKPYEKFFFPCEEYPTWDSVLKSSVEWAHDNHETEKLHFLLSVDCEIRQKIEDYFNPRVISIDFVRKHIDDISYQLRDTKEFFLSEYYYVWNPVFARIDAFIDSIKHIRLCCWIPNCDEDPDKFGEFVYDNFDHNVSELFVCFDACINDYQSYSEAVMTGIFGDPYDFRGYEYVFWRFEYVRLKDIDEFFDLVKKADDRLDEKHDEQTNDINEQNNDNMNQQKVSDQIYVLSGYNHLDMEHFTFTDTYKTIDEMNDNVHRLLKERFDDEDSISYQIAPVNVPQGFKLVHIDSVSVYPSSTDTDAPSQTSFSERVDNVKSELLASIRATILSFGGSINTYAECLDRDDLQSGRYSVFFHSIECYPDSVFVDADDNDAVKFSFKDNCGDTTTQSISEVSIEDLLWFDEHVKRYVQRYRWRRTLDNGAPDIISAPFNDKQECYEDMRENAYQCVSHQTRYCSKFVSNTDDALDGETCLWLTFHHDYIFVQGYGCNVSFKIEKC